MAAADLSEELFNRAKPVVEGEGVLLLDVEAKPGSRTILRFVIDGDGGVTIDDCVRVNRAVGGFLETWERAPRSFVVEVTSPGLDRKIRRRLEYDHFRGRLVRLHAEMEEIGAREFRGILEGLDREDVLLRVEGEIVRIPVERIRSARLSFEAPGASGSGRKR
jgi:ribosome maturation factor RimP